MSTVSRCSTRERLFQTATSAKADDGRGSGPVNQFHHRRTLADPRDRTIVSPNSDTLYSSAWLDLRREPQIIHAPAIRDRFFVLPLYSPYQENFANIGSVDGDTHGGDWAVVGPHFTGRLPKGVTRVRSPYDRVWVLGRTYIRDKADTRTVNRIQDRYTITPLSRFGRRTRARVTPGSGTAVPATIPGTRPGEDPLAWYAALGRELTRFPPPAADAPILAELSAVGVGPGLDPASAGLSDDTLRGLRDAVTEGPADTQQKLVADFLAGFETHNGYLISDTGRYGTDYRHRMLVDKIGLGAPQSKIAVYPYAQTDRTGRPLTGASRYVLHLPKRRLPIPAQAFWSLTLYDMHQFFVPNPLNRYLLNDRSKLHYNADGSLDLYIQNAKPARAAQVANWLPAPKSAFNVLWRLYQPGRALKGILAGTGWLPPAILACDDAGRASDGTACAS